MALVVEDGTGLADAESYISVADADTRQSNLGNTTWAPLTTAAKEEALRRATQYMLSAYRDRWLGYRDHRLQGLDWPRWNVTVDGYYVDPKTVPVDVANACSELAVKSISGDLAPDLDTRVIREKVGPIETDYDFRAPQFKRFRAIDMMLSPYLKGGSNSAPLIRA